MQNGMIRLPSSSSSGSVNSFDSYPSVAPQHQPKLSRRGWFLVAAITIVVLLLSSTTSGTANSLELAQQTRLGAAIKSYLQVETPEQLEEICPECNSTIPGSFLLSPRFSTPLPTLEEAKYVHASKRTVKRFLVNEILIFSWLHPHFLPEHALAPLFQRFLTAPDDLLSLNLDGLEHDKPTLYMYTRTGDGGRLKANTRRLKYFRRHMETIREYNALVEQEGFKDGPATAKDRQLIWIVIEDGDHINQSLDQILRASGIPYLYFAHGPTHFYGNAQWNAAERAVHVLRDSFFGDGPVLNVDDDSKIMPELLQRIWKVKRAVLWQVGNLGFLKDVWEGPIFEHGKLTDWYIGGMPKRTFPVDMGGFAFNSSMIGSEPTDPVHPPAYIPANDFGGESEFLEQILHNRTDIEPLCENTAAEKCYFVWHNWMENPKDNLKPLHS